ncbi:PREDICTED: E3 SUMO-protein ligase RanBP2-like [Ceratosolen solmsi marchali]|uniref:E3 SUMO-protein ligase RanBP2-like n=1 Tax=Ceratosolen solmsi marchali TaxID=326594 RepID=A0AAJ6YFP0_9HYME|nr:PREDICTED: E3 SUMO-protein ligase RanBP2-like [Ceratosolen solmsi marchali]
MIKKENKMEIIKFDPPIKSRYLPGEVNAAIENVDLKTYKAHRLNCINAKSVIDNKPPKFKLNCYYSKIKLNEDEYKAKLNFKCNMDIMKAINIISRYGGKVDCWRKKHKRPKLKVKSFRYERKFINKHIMRTNNIIYKNLSGMTDYGEFSPQVMAKNWKLIKANIVYKSRFPWFKEISKYPSITHNASLNNKIVQRSRCFFDLELAQSTLPLGRIVFELYNDYVPMTCANFEAFCRGFNGLSYKGTPFHRIISGYWCLGGDVIKYNGIGGASIFQTPSSDDDFSLEHSCPGVLSTYNDKKIAFDSRFNLTFRPLPSMDGRKVVFGKVIKGMQNLFKINAYGTKFGNPLQKIIVSNCGVLDKKRKMILR